MKYIHNRALALARSNVKIKQHFLLIFFSYRKNAVDLGRNESQGIYLQKSKSEFGLTSPDCESINRTYKSCSVR